LLTEEKMALEALHRNPFDKQVLTQMRELQLKAGSERLAAYFEGRIKEIDKEKSRQ
jgi:hypothetical protein